MKKQRRILMCLEQLNIGGVETAVLTLCKGYVRAGHKVFVAAKEGIFSSELKSLGIKCLNIEYDIVNHFVLEKKEELIKFCLENEITEVHFHQYPCVIYWLPVCMELNIPYIAYVHSIIPGTPQWFMKDFPVFRTSLPMFFENASKIVCIADKTKDEVESLFNIGEDHYKIIPNSLDMKLFENNNLSKDIKKFGIVARLAEEKYISITRGIDFFLEYSKEHKGCSLTIVGDGPILGKLREYAKGNKNITFPGKTSDVAGFMKKIDAYIGVDRSILEAMACKKLAIISSYYGSVNIITKDNIEKASEANFSGNNMDNDEDALSKLMNMSLKEYSNIVDSNYKFVNKKYSVENNIYKDDISPVNFPNYNYIFEEVNRLLKEIDDKNCVLVDTSQKPSITRRIINKGKRVVKRIVRR